MQLSRSMGAFFSGVHCENLVKLQEMKLTKRWASLMIWSHGFSVSQTGSTLSLQQFINYNSGPLSRHWFPQKLLLQQVVIFCICLSFSPILGVGVHLVTLRFLQMEEELLIFKFVQLFTCQGRMVTSKLLHAALEIRSPLDALDLERILIILLPT